MVAVAVATDTDACRGLLSVTVNSSAASTSSSSRIATPIVRSVLPTANVSVPRAPV